jgi:hypothetical protein
MITKDNDQSLYNINNIQNRNKKLKLAIPNPNTQSRNYNNKLIKDNNFKKYSVYSTKEATPGKEYNKVVMPSSVKNKYYKPPKDKNNLDELDDTLSQMSQILSNNKKDLNYKGMIGKVPGINEGPNFVYDQILLNKNRNNKAKILSHKIKVLKLPMSSVFSEEALTNCEQGKNYFSDSENGNSNNADKNKNKNRGKKKNNNNNDDDCVSISCCFFGK